MLRQKGQRVYGKSLKKGLNRRGRLEDSRVWMDLKIVDDNKLIGEWRERTSQRRLYFGVIHLVANGTKSELHGRWIGFNNLLDVQNDEWTMKVVSRSIRRRYRKEIEQQSATLL